MGGPKVIPSYAETEAGKKKYAQLLSLSDAGDVQGLVRTLPELELLWNDDPKGYLHAMSTNLQPLVKSKDPAVLKSALAALPRVIEKKCPPETERALFYFSAKYGIMGLYLEIETVRSDPNYYLSIADFLTEMRSRKIPNYRNQFEEKTADELLRDAGIISNNKALTEAQKLALSKENSKQKELDDMDRLQNTIRTLEKGIIDSLIACAPSASLENANKTNFYNNLSTRAQLTEDEKNRLESAK